MKLIICFIVSIVIVHHLPFEEWLGYNYNPLEEPDPGIITYPNIDVKEYIEFVQNKPYTRDELIVKVKNSVEEIELLKGLRDISRGFIVNPLNGWVIEARTPLSEDFNKWLRFIFNNAENYSFFELEKQLKDLNKIKRYL